MRKPMTHIDNFCRKHPNFGIPDLMKYIAIANVGFWALNIVNPYILSYLYFNPAMILKGQVWRLISFIFCPNATGLLALVAIYFYYWMGSTLERLWGTAKFNLYFFSGILLSEIYGFLMFFLTRSNMGFDAVYIYFSMFFAFATMFPDMQVLLFFFIPVKMKYLAIFDAVFFVVGVVTNPFPVNLLPVVALLNFVIFCGAELFAFVGRRPSANTVNFRRESQRIRREEAQSLYKHKCSVCGRTDKDSPGLEFRYCSRCEGYHCFCMDHIYNHIHFKE